MQTDVESLERATLDAVAPPEVVEIAEWLLPMDRSTIGRAISAVPVRHKNLSLHSIDAIESIYQSRGLRPQFRMPDVEECSDMHAVLKMKGYQPLQPTLVQVAPAVISSVSELATDVIVNAQPTVEWKAIYLASGFDPVDGQNRVDALSRSALVRYAHIVEHGNTLAGGTASYSHGWAGLHGMRTLPQARGRGLATGIIKALLQDIGENAPKSIYLQVEESNEDAVRLYGHLGFRTAWRYRYWKKPA